MNSRRRRSRIEVPVEVLRNRPSLNISEAARLTGFSRAKIREKLDSGEWRWFKEGAFRMVITQSILEAQENRALIDMAKAGVRPKHV